MRWDIWFTKLAQNVGLAVLIAASPAFQALARGESVNWRLTFSIAIGAGCLAVINMLINLIKHRKDPKTPPESS